MLPDDLAPRDAALLWEVVRHARELREHMGDVTRDQYLATRGLQRIAERLIEIIGEAARAMSPAGRAHYPSVPWPSIVKQRHVLAHDYGNIDQERLWTVIAVHVPVLLAQLPDAPPPKAPDSRWANEQ